MKEILDNKTGAILFKEEPQDLLPKRVEDLEGEVHYLRTYVDKLKYEIEKLKLTLNVK